MTPIVAVKLCGVILAGSVAWWLYCGVPWRVMFDWLRTWRKER